MSEKKESFKIYNLMIVDKSGSMSRVQDETISGLNAQLKSMKESQEKNKDQKQRVCVVQFDYPTSIDHESLWNKPINDVEDFTRETYCPRGSTALLDATAIAVEKLRKEIKDELKNRKATIVVTIFTDGCENSSVHFNSKQVADLMQEIQDTGQWTVSFAGCGGDVFEVAQSMRISESNTMSYAKGAEGTSKAFATMARARGAYSANVADCLANNKGLSAVQENFYDVKDDDNDGDDD